MRKIFLLFSACAFALNSWATEVVFDGIHYETINNNTTNLKVLAHESYANLTSVDIPSSFTIDATKYTVTEIESNAFYGCSNLTEVIIPGSVTSIGSNVFMGCTSLTEIIIPNSVTSIENNTFGGCRSLKRVTINSETIIIGNSAFSYCPNLEQVSFPYANSDNIALGSDVFSNCESLNLQYTEENGARYMVFEGNAYFQLVEVPYDITSFEINSNCKSISASVFKNRTNLTNITIPNGVKAIGTRAFYGCSSLEQITIPGSVRLVGTEVFASCRNLKRVVVEEGASSVGYDPFRDCELESLTLPSTVNLNYSLSHNSLKQLILPGSFDYKPYYWAINSNGLEEILCEAESRDACGFWGNLYLPSESVCKYVWNYKNKTVTATAGGDASGGTVTVEGGQTHAYGSQVKLTATPNEGFKFVGWDDGNHDNPRTITVQDNEVAGNSGVNTYTAFFYDINQPTYDIVVNTKGKGTTTGGGIYLPDAQVTLTAEPLNPGNYNIYRFVGWSDGWSNGNIINPRTFKATENVNLTAVFEGQEVTVGDNTVKAVGQMTDNCTFHPTISGRYTISTTSENYLNTYGYLFDEDGNKLAEDGNSAGNGNFQFGCNLEAGQIYTIGAGFNDTEKEGDITLCISQPQMIIRTSAEGNGIVEGTGYYSYNGLATLTPKPAEGNHFVKWKDNNSTANPRTIEHVTESATYTAIFEINEYDITATGYSNGTIEGAKKYNHGQTVKLTATAADGYHFVDWGEGTTSETTITFTATKDTAFTPSFAINTYTLTATGANGSFEGIKASYNHGAKASITAKPNEGYEFASWRDGKTANPLDTIVTSNVALEAIFVVKGHTLYTIKVKEPQNGTVTGGGVYEEDSIATLTATPAEGYHFVKWTDNVANYKREIVVKSDSTFEAVFAINTYTVSVAAADNGTVSGAKTYNHGDNVKIVATPDNGYHFAAWSTGETADTLKFVATKDTAFTPSFEINRYKVSGVAENGSISGLRTYNHGSEANLSAYPETGYHFVKWADGETSFNRSLTVTCDTSFKALFEINTYKATVIESEHGTVSGAGEYTHGQTASFTATADAGYQFLFWSDGGTANPRSIKMTQDVDVRAVFSLEGHSAFNVGVGTSGNGTVTGGGLYIEGETATLTAKPSSEAYHFVEWSDGNKENPRNVVVDKALNFTATFAINTYTVKAATHKDEAERGTVTGGDTYTYGSMATLRATPAEGYRFTNWSDGDVYNIKFIEVKEDMSFTAHFAPAVGVDYVYVDVHDTLVVTDTLKVQEILKEYVRDTITVKEVVEKIVRDTVTIEGTGNDTVYVRENVYTNDTIYVAVHDTVTVVDSAIRTVVDMLLEMVHDTVYAQSAIDSLIETLVIRDTIYITKTDTIFITKTDTVYLQTSARQASAVNMSVYPNPTSSFVTVDADSEFSFVLTNASGKVLRKEENAQSYILDLSAYPAGIYLLTTSDGATHKIVKK